MCNSCGVSVSQRLLTQLIGFTTLEVSTLTFMPSIRRSVGDAEKEA